MLKQMSKLEMVIEGKIYALLCDSDSPLANVKEFVFQCQKYIGQIEDAVKASQEKQKAEEDAKAAEKPEEEPKPAE